MNLREILRSKKDSNGIWGELAKDDSVDTGIWLRRGLSRFVFTIASVLTVGGLIIGGSYIFNLVNQQPNVTEVVKTVSESMFEVECGEWAGTGVAVKMPLPSNYKTAVWSAAHIFDDCKAGDQIRLINNGKVMFGTLAGKDPVSSSGSALSAADLALIYLRAEVPALAPAPQANLGDWAIVVGNPWDEINYVTFGVVSSVTQDEYKTDAAVNEGNSGGPMIDSKGRVLGLVSYKPIDTEVTVDGSAIQTNTAEGIAAIKRLRLACQVILADMGNCPFSD